MQGLYREPQRCRTSAIRLRIETVHSVDGDVHVTFSDITGEMQGTVHGRVLETWPGELGVGAALSLKRVAVISMSRYVHHLVVTIEMVTNIVGGGYTAHRRPSSSPPPQPVAGAQNSWRCPLQAVDHRAGGVNSMPAVPIPEDDDGGRPRKTPRHAQGPEAAILPDEAGGQLRVDHRREGCGTGVAPVRLALEPPLTDSRGACSVEEIFSAGW